MYFKESNLKFMSGNALKRQKSFLKHAISSFKTEQIFLSGINLGRIQVNDFFAFLKFLATFTKIEIYFGV